MPNQSHDGERMARDYSMKPLHRRSHVKPDQKGSLYGLMIQDYLQKHAARVSDASASAHRITLAPARYVSDSILVRIEMRLTPTHLLRPNSESEPPVPGSQQQQQCPSRRRNRMEIWDVGPPSRFTIHLPPELTHGIGTRGFQHSKFARGSRLQSPVSNQIPRPLV
ncbi:hypothetical protein BO71DRAFT_436245 [Aspergillus ellipticus CBS 707.79]|uniref:Uncharacterized protein n=1 Tax=Aspergillus ellipticus CBS 707.79 TaxID=1448320 RepID=A0A319DA49_9EURO|nr:hypothetical protein BO71DRAFT_436245 [Aspergillus ellipticus CBS 707.79]